MKEIYIDLMEKVADAYTAEHIRRYTDEVIERGLEEHGFPRLTANLGILIAHGRKLEYQELFLEMMNLCLREIPTARSRNGRRVGNDFSVKEIVFCLLETEKAASFPKEITDGWREELKKINPYLTYSVISAYPTSNMANWAAFGAANEQLRKYAGISEENFFIENQIASQFHAFDENGMYRDPGCPVLYDIVGRLQLAAALYYGFDGAGAERLSEELIKSADKTLYMQSATGEIPFGGRSNQFLFNEAAYAALCEFYADFFKKRGCIERAGMFKRAARIAAESILPRLEVTPVRHIKNFYPTDSMYGCESYAYYDKYMVTTGSMLYLAYAMADDTIPEMPCPAESENYICETSASFHRAFLKYKDYFVQIDTAAEEHYDASGIGRIHKKGSPSAICLSMPFSSHPGYRMDIENPAQFSICAGLEKDGESFYTCESNIVYELTEKEITEKYVKASYACSNESGLSIRKTCIVSGNGVEIKAEGDGNIRIDFPVFAFDGETETKVTVSENHVTVEYKEYVCIYKTDGEITEGELYANRNGHYTRMTANGKDSVTLKVEIKESI